VRGTSDTRYVGIRSVCVVLCACVSATLIPAGVAVADPSQGAVVGWGDNSVGQTNDPAPNSGFIAVAAGSWHSLGLKADGSIAAWGCGDPHYFDEGQCNVPALNADFIGIAGGGYHSLGLRADGSIVAWGAYYDGQTNIPSPNTDFIAVAAGTFYSLGLKGDGSIVGWGRHDYGQTNVPAPNTDFIAIAANLVHSLGLKDDGSIVAWGSNYDGQTNVPAPNANFIGIAAGGLHSLGLKADGSIVAWGWNHYGQTNVPAPNTDFIGIAAGTFHSLGLKSDGSIVAWGYNYYGQAHVPAPNTGFFAVAVGGSHSLGLKADRDSDGVPDVSDNCPTVANPDQSDVDYDGLGDSCDDCPDSDVGETIVIDGCDTGITNDMSDEGCTPADAVAACADQARNHGQFVQCIALLANGWKRSGAITDADRGRIIRCAARADIPPSDDEQTNGPKPAARRPDRALQRSDTQQPLPLSNGKDGIQKVPGQRGGGP